MLTRNLTRSGIGAVLLLSLGLAACDFDALNTDPNNPTSAPISTVLPNATMNVVFALTGTDSGWYPSVWVQHTAGVHAQLRDADQLQAITPASLNNTWNALYATTLQDLQYIIDVGSEAGNWNYVGIAQVLQAYSFQYATDLWGPIPYRQALQGREVLQPEYDTQEFIYGDLPRLLDEAIANLQRESVGMAGRFDLIHGTNAASRDRWIRAAYALKARVANRQSKRNPTGSAQAALAAAENSFTSAAEELTFRGYTSSATAAHPWHQERGARGHHAWGARMDNLMLQYEDPRRALFAQPMPAGNANAGQIIPAPNAAAENDQAGALYSKLSTNVINPTAPQPLITYAEVMFIKADAHQRLGQFEESRTALEAGIRAAMRIHPAATPTQAAIDTYVANEGVIPANDADLMRRIAEEKWIMLFPFQAAEAWAEWRRTGFPTLTNPQGEIFRRAPIAQREFDTNPANANANRAPLTNGVWWDDGTEL